MSFSLEDAGNALAAIPPDCDRDTWVHMAMAIKSEFGEAAFEIWDGWSASAPTYKAPAARDVWKSIRQSKGVGIGSLIQEAKRCGWQPRQEQSSKEARAERKAEQDLRRKKREAEAQKDESTRRAWHDRVAKACLALWDRLSDSGASPYLRAKRVGSFGLGFVGRGLLLVTHIEEERIEVVEGKKDLDAFFARQKAGEIDREVLSFHYCKPGITVVPMRDAAGDLWSLQFIFSGGKKRFPKFGRKSGLFHMVAKAEQLEGTKLTSTPLILAVCEGYATAASIHMATGWPVAVAFDAGNLLAVAQALRGIYPDTRLVICGDDDRETKGNPGHTKALAAARASGGVSATPAFGDGSVAAT